MSRRGTPNRTELAVLHDKISGALTLVIETDSDEMGLSDLEAGLLWCELRDVQSDVVAAMVGKPPAYLRARSTARLCVVAGAAASRIPAQRARTLAS